MASRDACDQISCDASDQFNVRVAHYVCAMTLAG